MFRVMVKPYFGADSSTTHEGFETYGQASNFISMLPPAADATVEKKVNGVWSSKF